MKTGAAKPFDALPSISPPGGFRAFQKDRVGALRRFIDEPAPIARVPAMSRSLVIANGPAPIHEILVEKARCFEKSPVLRMTLHPLAGQGLFTSEGDLWRRQRKLMSPIFHTAQIKHFASCMAACGARATDTWRDGQTLDIAAETTRIAMSVAGRTLFDVDMFGEAEELGQALTTALHWTGSQVTRLPLIAQAVLRTNLMLLAGRASPPLSTALNRAVDALLRPLLLPGEETRELKRALAVLDRRVTRMIEDRRKNPGKDDLLSCLLTARDEDDGATMSDRQVKDEILTLFIAGHETTAAALAWALMLLCQHPDAYARAASEARALPSLPGYEDLPRLAYCLRVFKESMRLYPPIFIFGRQAITDVEIGGYLLPNGTICITSPYVVHRKPELWPDPERFDPDRFTAEAEAARPRSSYFPFSLGPRTCIGNHFALMEGPIVLATLLRHADFELVDPRGAEPDLQATLRPKGGLPMRIHLRNRETAAA